MTKFIGIRVYDKTDKKGKVVHINLDFIKSIDEKEMRLYLDDNTNYRIDEESLDVFLYAVYGKIED